MVTTAGNGAQIPRIVMIDDEPSNLQIVKIILSREHFPCQLDLFEGGEKALEYLAREGADLILLDLSMPGMDGFQVMKALKADPVMKDIPVVFLSAYHDTKYILDAFQLGATDFIGKPIISPLLIARLNNVLQARQLQQQLIRSNQELVATNQLKDDLLSICSHDLRSPLSSIDLLCQFMVDALGGQSENTPAELVSRIATQARMARRLVENLLDMSKIEEGRLLPQPSFFQLNDLIRTAAEGESPFVEAKALTFDMELPEEDWICYGDREMLGHVVHNVLNNALKHAGKKVALTVRILSFTEDLGGRIGIHVADDGAGIPPEYQEHIFEKFSKGEAQSGGSGLGLYISRQMVGLLNGTIRVVDTGSGGTTMGIDIPNVFRPEQLPDLHELSDRRVLVFSISKVTRELLTGLLTEAGLVEVVPVSSVDGLMREQKSEQGGAGSNLVVLDAESQGLITESLKAAIHGGGTQPASALAKAVATSWLVYGGSETPELPSPCRVVNSPLNPLEFLRALDALSQPPGDSRAAGGV